MKPTDQPPLSRKEVIESDLAGYATEPAATLPACLCGLDTNPVASPRMDIHCPKHDALDGEAEMLTECAVCKQKVLGFFPVCRVCTNTARASQPADRLKDKGEPLLTPARSIDDAVARLRFKNVEGLPYPHGYNDGLDALADHVNAMLARQTQPLSTPADEEFNPWYENYEKALVAEVSSPTPADEVARAVVGTVFHNTDASHETLERTMIERVALAEARRAGTPTTDARREQVKAIVREWLSDKTVNMLTRFTADDNFVTEPLINAIASAFSSTPGDDDYVAWCHYVNHGTDDSGADVLTIETCDSDAKGAFKVYGHATPSDEVAQRARAVLAAVEIEKLWQPQHTVDDCGACCEYRKAIIAMIQKHCFTTTDVEQGTCTWTCEPNPDIETWETDCGNAFQFEADGPTENKMKSCCYCGKPLAEKVAERREEGEGDG